MKNRLLIKTKLGLLSFIALTLFSLSLVFCFLYGSLVNYLTSLSLFFTSVSLYIRLYKKENISEKDSE